MDATALSANKRAGPTRYGCILALIGGAACGATLFAAVGASTHLEAAGAFAGGAVGAVVGRGLWSGRVSVMTVGGILGGVFFSGAGCVPSGIYAPFGFVVGYCVTFVLRGILRAIRGKATSRPWLTSLWLVWIVSVAIWMLDAIPGYVPAYGIIFLLALEAGPERYDDAA